MGECIPDRPQAAEEHYQQGYHLFEAGEWEPALDELRLCLEYNPWKRKYVRFYSQIAAQLIAHHYKQVGEDLQRQGQFAEAISSYQRVLKLKIDPRGFRRLIRQVKQLEQWSMAIYEQACQLLAQEKLTKARRKTLEVLEHLPHWEKAQTLLALTEQREEAQELYARGAELYRRGHYEEARRLLEQSRVLDKDYSAPGVLLNRIEQELSKSDYEATPEPAPTTPQDLDKSDYEPTPEPAPTTPQELSKSDYEPEPASAIPLEESILLLEEAAEVPFSDNSPAEKLETES